MVGFGKIDDSNQRCGGRVGIVLLRSPVFLTGKNLFFPRVFDMHMGGKQILHPDYGIQDDNRANQGRVAESLGRIWSSY